jgi:hypothetical protein
MNGIGTHTGQTNIQTFIFIYIEEKCLENENVKFQKSLSRYSIIDARAHYWAAALLLRSIDVEEL